jgi:hypothetical protein
MLPLKGITVISIEQAVAAPFATRQLADLGARVIKIERPDGGDFARGYDTRVKGLSSYFVWLNRSKESLTLDLKRPECAEVLARLVSRSDVFVQNLAPGAAERLGTAPSVLRDRHPRLIVCNVSGYGSSGPYAKKKAYDLLVQSEVGLVSITGGPDSPARAGISVADIAAGMYAYSGILTRCSPEPQPAAAPRSRCRCSTRSRSGWASLRTTRPTAMRPRRAAERTTHRLRRTVHFVRATASRSFLASRTRVSGRDFVPTCCPSPNWRTTNGSRRMCCV